MNLLNFNNIVYLIVTITVVILTTIKQFNKQSQKQEYSSKLIITNLEKIEKQNIKILSLIEMHSQDINLLKKDFNNLEHRVSKLEEKNKIVEEKHE